MNVTDPLIIPFSSFYLVVKSVLFSVLISSVLITSLMRLPVTSTSKVKNTK